MSIALTLGVGLAPAQAAAPAVPASVGAATGLTDAAVRPAANLSLFRPGHIISDAVFYNSGSMTETQIQAFLEAQMPSCASGFTCLRDYRDTSTTRGTDAMCAAYQGVANERASRIILRVAHSCGINPQVLLVTLQKEQGLITNPAPSASRYQIAMGQGCPDTAACDTRYYGFFNQVYGAAWQLKRYENPPGTSQYFTWYAPGRTWNVRFHPNTACGSSPVYIENKATAALYYYTPYQPNAASIAAYSGLGDGCSSHGNRNFYRYFVDWFGGTSYAVSGGLLDYWQARGSAGGDLGEPTAAMSIWPGAGWSQPFVGADLLQRLGSPSVYAVGGAFRTVYRTVGHFWSGLGWPTGNQVAVAGGWYQDFQGGRSYVRPDGRGFAVAAPMNAAYESLANITGMLGWPKGYAYRVANGSQQDFDGGSLFAAPRGVIGLKADVASFYARAGGPAGILGWPAAAETSDRAGGHILFDRAWLQRVGSGFLLVKGAIFSAYVAADGIDGVLGAATGPELYDGTGWYQDFQNGSIYHSTAGTYAVSALRAELASFGGVAALGYPRSPEIVTAAGASQTFGALTLAKPAQGAVQVVKGAIGAHYAAVGGVGSILGAPTGPERSVPGGWYQDFQGGRIVCGPAGTFTLPSAVVAVHDAAGASGGRLGWPAGTAVAETGGWRQPFTGGTVFASSAAGGAGGGVFGAVLPAYLNGGGPTALGFPIEKESIVPTGAWRQRFERGAVYVPSGYPASSVGGDIYRLYTQLGLDAGVGLPVAARVLAPGGSWQDFQAVSIYATGTGPWYTRGLIRDIYRSWGGPTGSLGWPTQSMQTVAGGWRQAFTGGGIFVGSGGSFVVKGSLGREYLARGGESGALGWPLGGEVLSGGLWTQRFQNGTLVLMPDGTFQVR